MKIIWIFGVLFLAGLVINDFIQFWRIHKRARKIDRDLKELTRHGK
jgi:hypothetical protein